MGSKSSHVTKTANETSYSLLELEDLADNRALLKAMECPRDITQYFAYHRVPQSPAYKNYYTRRY